MLLGYTVEFMQEEQIFRKYGSSGITEYELTNGKALVSDDTQMTLFTANGILVGDTRLSMRGIGGDPKVYVPNAYLDWLKTQQLDINSVNQYERYTEKGWIFMVVGCSGIVFQTCTGQYLPFCTGNQSKKRIT